MPVATTSSRASAGCAVGSGHRAGELDVAGDLLTASIEHGRHAEAGHQRDDRGGCRQPRRDAAPPVCSRRRDGRRRTSRRRVASARARRAAMRSAGGAVAGSSSRASASSSPSSSSVASRAPPRGSSAAVAAPGLAPSGPFPVACRAAGRPPRSSGRRAHAARASRGRRRPSGRTPCRIADFSSPATACSSGPRSVGGRATSCRARRPAGGHA